MQIFVEIKGGYVWQSTGDVCQTLDAGYGVETPKIYADDPRIVRVTAIPVERMRSKMRKMVEECHERGARRGFGR
jgi:hypothetical protein